MAKLQNLMPDQEARKAKRKATALRYYVKNREKIAAKRAKHRVENREIYLEKEARFRSENPEKTLAYQAKYRDKQHCRQTYWSLQGWT